MKLTRRLFPRGGEVRVGGNLLLPSHKHGGLPSAPLLWLQVDSYAEGDAESLRGTVRDLLAKLQEAERQHQSDRVAFEVSREMWGGRARAWGCWLRGPATFPAWTSRLSGCAPSRHRLERLGLGAWGTSCLLSLSWVSVRGQPWFGARLCRRAAAMLVWQSMSRKRHFAEHQDEELRALGSAWAGRFCQVAWHGTRRAARTRGWS